MKNIGLFFAVVLLSVNVYSQTTIETFKADFKKIVLDKKFQVWEERHFKVLFLILQKLGYSWAKNCFHLSNYKTISSVY